MIPGLKETTNTYDNKTETYVAYIRQRALLTHGRLAHEWNKKKKKNKSKGKRRWERENKNTVYNNAETRERNAKIEQKSIIYIWILRRIWSKRVKYTHADTYKNPQNRNKRVEQIIKKQW